MGLNTKKEVVGVFPFTYKQKSTGYQISAVKLYISEPMPSPGLGMKVTEIFLDNSIASDYPLGPIITVLYEPTYAGRSKAVGVLYADALKAKA